MSLRSSGSSPRICSGARYPATSSGDGVARKIRAPPAVRAMHKGESAPCTRPRECTFCSAAPISMRAGGELSVSAEWRKRALRAADIDGRTRRWREYCCESFCDTAAWLYSARELHEEFTLGAQIG